MTRVLRLLIFLWAMLATSVAGAQSPEVQQAAHTVRLTSPLGRTGETAEVRIVAQVQRPVRTTPAPTPIKVRFYVDNALVGTVEAAPYAVPWSKQASTTVRAVRPRGSIRNPSDFVKTGNCNPSTSWRARPKP